MYRSTFSQPQHQLEVSGQLHVLATLPQGTHCIGGWVGPRAGLNDVEKRILDPTGTRTPIPWPSSP
jgi:hypothetical protein